MKLLDIMTSPWAIKPEALKEIRAIYEAHMRGEKIDIKGLEAKTGVQFQSRGEKGYELVNGVAVIDLKGVLTKEMTFFTWLFGGTSMKAVAQSLKDVLADSSVTSILFYMDSPGGTVDGTQELANLIYDSRGKKPIIGYSDGMITSGAYWIASALDAIYISNDTVEVGSIGVITTHVDVSKMLDNAGMKFTEIVGGKYKRTASMFKPLSDEGKAEIQNIVDYLFSVFVEDVARNRGVTVENVINVMSAETQPPIFFGKQAIEAKMVDGMATFDSLVDSLAGGVLMSKNKKKEEAMSIENLKAEHPEVFQAIYDSGFEAGKQKGQDEVECPEECQEKAKKEGASAELARIKAVKEKVMPGHEALIETLMFDGKTSGPDAAALVLDAEKKKLAGALKDREAELVVTTGIPTSVVLEMPGMSPEQASVNAALGISNEQFHKHSNKKEVK